MRVWAQLKPSAVPGHFAPHLGERPGSGAHLMCDADGRQDRYEEGGGIVVSMVPDYSVYLDSLI